MGHFGTYVPEVAKDRVGVKFSPRMPFNDIEEADANVVYPYILERLNKRHLAYVHVADYAGEGWHAKLRPIY